MLTDIKEPQRAWSRIFFRALKKFDHGLANGRHWSMLSLHPFTHLVHSGIEKCIGKPFLGQLTLEVPLKKIKSNLHEQRSNIKTNTKTWNLSRNDTVPFYWTVLLLLLMPSLYGGPVLSPMLTFICIK